MSDTHIQGLGSDPAMQTILLVGPATRTRDLAHALRSIAHSLCCDTIQQVQRIVETQDVELIICIGLAHAQLGVCLEGLGETCKVIVISEDALQINQGTIYLCLIRLVQKGWVDASWGTSENNRKAKFYAISKAGKKQLAAETRNWERVAGVIGRVLDLSKR